MNRIIKAAIVSGFTVAVAGTVLTAGADDRRCHEMKGQSHGWQDQGDYADHMAKRQAELKKELKLNADQEAAWNTFSEKMKPAATEQRRDRSEMSKLNAPERMDAMLAMLKEREAKLADRTVAVKEFYATLTAEQQKIFDDEFMGQYGRHRKMHDKSMNPN